jgi:hypothetical protein
MSSSGLEVVIRALFCYKQTDEAISNAQHHAVDANKMERLIVISHVFAIFQLLIFVLDIIFVIGLLADGGSASVVGGLLLAIAMAASFNFTRLGGKRMDDDGGLDWAPAFQNSSRFYKGIPKEQVEMIQLTFALVFTELCAFFLEDGAYIGVAFSGLGDSEPSFLDRLNARLTWFKAFCAGLISILAFLVAVSMSCCKGCCKDDDDGDNDNDEEQDTWNHNDDDDEDEDSFCVKFWKYFFFMGFWCYVFTFWSFALASITEIAKGNGGLGADGSLWWGYYGFYWPPGIYFAYLLWKYGKNDKNGGTTSNSSGGSSRAAGVGSNNKKSKASNSRCAAGSTDQPADPTQNRKDGDAPSSTTGVA